MPVTIPEVLNNLLDGQPQLVRALMAVLPNVKKITISPVIVATITTAEQTFACNGLAVGDFVAVVKPTAQAGLGIVGARVTAANTLGITFDNPTAAGITPTAAETYLVLHAPGLLSGLVNTLP